MSAHFDGWRNILTGLGTERDKGTFAECLPTVLTQQQCEDLWRGDDMADKIVTSLPGDALREGVTLSIASIEDADQRAATVEAIKAAIADLGFEERLQKGLQYERAYGGAAIFVGAVDGALDMSEPLDMESIRQIKHLTLFERRSIRAVEWEDNPFAKDYGKAKLYEVYSWSGVATGQKVHESRLIVFPGRRVTERNPTENEGWGDSVLALVYDVLRNFNQAWLGAGYTLNDFSVAIMKIKGLAAVLAANKPDDVAARAQAIELGRSIAKTILLDSEEEYERKTTSLAGMPEVLDKFNTRLAAAASMPVTRLFGVSAAGLNATGAGDARNWYDAVGDYQTKSVLPAYERFLRILFRAKAGPTKGIEPDNWTVSFPPLWQPTEQERATTRKMVAETDAIYYDMGVVTSSEVRSSRFGSDEYSSETVIDNTPPPQLPPAETVPNATPAPSAQSS